jgi:hypothetical protein
MPKLLDEVAAAEAVAKSQARAMYAEVLRRSDDPQQGDTARLQEAMRALDLTAADAVRDAATLKSAADLEAKFAGLPEAEAERVAASRAVVAQDAAWAKLEREHDKRRVKLVLASNVLGIEEQRCRAAGKALKALQERNRALFGLPPADRTAESGRPGMGTPVMVRSDAGTVAEPPRRIEQGVFHRAATAEQK